MPNKRTDEHVQKENCDCQSIIEKVDGLDYGDDFGNADEEIDVSKKD